MNRKTLLAAIAASLALIACGGGEDDYSRVSSASFEQTASAGSLTLRSFRSTWPATTLRAGATSAQTGERR